MLRDIYGSTRAIFIVPMDSNRFNGWASLGSVALVPFNRIRYFGWVCQLFKGRKADIFFLKSIY